MNLLRSASPPLPSAEPLPSLAWPWSPWTIACSPEPSEPQCTQGEAQSPQDMAPLALAAFLALHSLPHHFTLAAGLVPALFTLGPATLGQLLMSRTPLAFHFPLFLSQPTGFLDKVKYVTFLRGTFQCLR